MPSTSTMVYPIPGYVRVEANWADVGAAVGAAVYRVDCLTGDRVPLRPYVAFDGDFLDLTCGYGIWWDTEPQLDRCVYYCTQAQDAAGDLVTQPGDYLVTDTFTRVVANGWGSADTGQVWVNEGGVNGDYSVNGTTGLHSVGSIGVTRRTLLDGPANMGFLYRVAIPALSTGVAAQHSWIAREDGTNNNMYLFRALYLTTGRVELRISVRVAGVETTIANPAGDQADYTAGSYTWVRGEAWGTLLRMKAWQATMPEPADWQVSVNDSTFIGAGRMGFRSDLPAGWLGAVPTVFSMDDLTVYDPCGPVVVVESCSDDLVVPSSGDFRFGDPVRPCNDVILDFTAEIGPTCVPTQGIYFGNMADESDPANSGTFTPVNAKFPIVASRTRGSMVSALTVVSATFPDRDALRTLRDPGSPLLLRGPAQYGIDDRYMSLGDVTEHRPVSDHRVQPRGVEMPHVAVARPSGPSQGVCGTRVEDLCDIYATWDDLIAAGVTYPGLLRGDASTGTPLPATAARTWDDVNAEFTDWDDLDASEPDWGQTLAGD